MMKKLQLIGFTLMAVMFLASCGGGNNDTIKTEREDAEKTAKESVTESPTIEEVENVSSNNAECDEFLNGYENFMDNYIVILKKSLADPSDMSVLTEYMSLMTEASEWTSKTPDCTDTEFLLKLSKIQMKMTIAASGM